jgi:two-component system, sensor histidine kinase YesM
MESNKIIDNPLKKNLVFKPSSIFVDLKLRYKLLFFYLFVVFIPILTLGMIFTLRITDILMNQNIRDSISSVNIIKENLKNNIKILVDVSDYIYVNYKTYSQLIKKFDDPADSIAAYIDTFYPVIGDTQRIHSRFIRSISVFTENSTIIPNGAEIQYASQDIREQQWYIEALKFHGERLWSNAVQTIDINGKKSFNVTLYRSLNNFQKTSSAGLLRINVDENYFYNLISSKDWEKRFYLVSLAGNIVSSNDRSVLGKNAKEVAFMAKAFLGDEGLYDTNQDNQKYKVIYSTFSTDNMGLEKWKVISVIPLDNIYKSVNEARNFGIFICVLCFIILTTVVFLFSHGITERIRKLVEKTHRVSEGNYDEIVDITGKDEVAELGLSFNKMLTNLNQLINEVYESRINMQQYEIKKKEAELNALQNQINPHFLYNTLDAIRMHAIISDNNNLGDMLISLSALLRYSINRGKEIVRIKDEINYVENYISILNMRYDDSIILNINISEEIIQCKILKLILQPLVENAFNHGLKTKKKDRVIDITGELKDGVISLNVEDNGVGMTEENVEALNKELMEIENKENIKASIGLNNVNGRIKLYFGKEYGIKIYSQIGTGTRVSLILPMYKEE